ncbi:MAG: membrane dipeptidase [Acidimicrobiales bacterium]
METPHGPWIDVHAHPGRCFLAGLDTDAGLAQLLGGDGSIAALEAAHAAGLTAVGFATVADLVVLARGPDGGLHAGRAFAPGEAHADHQRQLAGLAHLVEATGAPLARTAGDLEAAHAAGSTAVLVTCEGGDFLEGRIDRVAEAHAQGMSSLTLVHYRVNELGDIQTEAPEHGGLTAFGADVVRACNDLGVVIDCAHATLATTLGVLEASSRPVMISHSHLDHADRSHPRLLSGDHARAVTDAGGLIGAWPSGVTSRTLADFVDEIVRLVELVGVDHVAIGTDLDANHQPVVTAHAQLVDVEDQLRSRGVTESDVDRVLGGNVVELYRSVASR